MYKYVRITVATRNNFGMLQVIKIRFTVVKKLLSAVLNFIINNKAININNA